MSSAEILKTAVNAGFLMLSNGGETYRVEDTIMRIITASGIHEAGVFATTTGVFASIEEDGGEIVTLVKRVKERTYNLEKIALINDISRAYVGHEITIEETNRRLEQIPNRKGNSALVTTIASGMSCFCFTYMLGGTFGSSANAFVIGILLNLVLIFFRKQRISSFITNIFSGSIIAIATILLIHFGFNKPELMDSVIIGAMMPLLPGVGITNAVRDILEGDYLSGTSRIVDATLVAVCIASGVGVVLSVWFYVFGGF